MTAPFERRGFNETFENRLGPLLVDSSCAIEERHRGSVASRVREIYDKLLATPAKD